MGYVQTLFQITSEMIEELNKFEKNEQDRPTTIEHMTTLIERRDEVIKQIKPPYSDDEMKLGQQVITLNEEIQKKMQDLYTSVKEDMNKVKKQKQSRRSYINPYGNLKTTDGMYVDHKK